MFGCSRKARDSRPLKEVEFACVQAGPNISILQRMPVSITAGDQLAEISHHANFRSVGSSEINSCIKRRLGAQASLDLSHRHHQRFSNSTLGSPRPYPNRRRSTVPALRLLSSNSRTDRKRRAWTDLVVPRWSVRACHDRPQSLRNLALGQLARPD